LPDTEPAGQTASDLLLQVLNGPTGANAISKSPGPFLPQRASDASPPSESSTVLTASILAPNASALPPPSALTSAAWNHPYGAVGARDFRSNPSQSFSQG